jgi:hypothetical protein
MAKPKDQDPGDVGLVFAAHNTHHERYGAPPRLRNTDRHRGVRREPDVGQELVESPGGLGRETTEDVVDEGERVEVVMLTGAGQGVQDRRRPAATVTPQDRS